MFKKTLSIFLALGVILCLSACGNKTEDNTTENNAASTELQGNEAEQYAKGVELYEQGDHLAAYEYLAPLGDYKDVREYMKNYLCVPQKEVEIEADDIATTEYTYDSKGNLVKEVYTKQSGEELKRKNIYVYTYDSNNNVIKMVQTNKDGDVSTTEYTSYDDKGNLLKSIYTDADGETSTTEYAYTYDNRGNLLKQSESYDDYTTTSEYTYDSNNNLVKEVQIEFDEVMSTSEYTYDSRGNLTKSVWTSSEDYVSTNEYSYDNKGKLIKNIITDPAYMNQPTPTDYTYDNNGNLVKEIFTFPSGGTRTTEYSDYLVFYRPDKAE